MENSTNKKFKNQYLEIALEEDVVCVRYFQDVVVDLEAAKTILRDRLAFANGKAHVYYVDVREAKYWTKEAREFQSTDANHELVKAFAMHINSAVQKTIVNFYLYFNKPKVPTRAFPSKEAAFNWLNQFK